MKFNNKNVLLLLLFGISIILLSGTVSAQSSNISLSEESDSYGDVTMNGIEDSYTNVLSDDKSITNSRLNTVNKNKTIKTDKLSKIYVTSDADSSCSGSDRNNPTSLTNAIENIIDGGTIYLVTNNNNDTYNLSSRIDISSYSTAKSFNIIGESGKNIILTGNNITSVLYSYQSNLNISNINFANTYYNSQSTIYISSSNVTFTDCNFYDNFRNTTGSTIYSSYSTLNITNCNFNNNSAAYGGVLYTTRSNVNINSSNFTNNTAFSGACIYNTYSNITLISTNLIANNATYGASIFNYNSNTRVNNSTFSNNKALYYGGAIIQINNGTLTINNSEFTSNEALNGGSIYIMQSNVNITSSIFENNNASEGSSIYAYNNTVMANNNCFNDGLNRSQIHMKYVKSYDINENWWSTNNPDFLKLTNAIIPDSWVLMSFKAIENSDNEVIVSLNQLSNSSTISNNIPERTVTFSGDGAEFDFTESEFVNNITNNYQSNSTVYATIDNQVLELDAKITPILLADNYTTQDNNINIIIYSNGDITGQINITLNNNSILLNSTRKMTVNLSLDNLNTTTYPINILYGGNTKYAPTTTTAFITIQPDTYIQNDTITNTITKNDTTVVLPSRYNLATLNQTTPVKSQGSSGSCVVFATVGAIESSLKKLTNISYDLSENNMKNIFKKYSILGFSGLEPNDGGYDMEPVGYMASGLGPVLEEMDEYNTNSHISNIFNSTIQIQNIYFIPARENFLDNNQIKEAIMKYGAVYTGVKLSSSLNQYNINVNEATHAVCIVGWDDNYSKSNFATTPPDDGAFIIKNSWGVTTGNEGYQYVSYYDSVIGNIPYVGDYNTLNFVVDCDNLYNYTNIYQYDTVCYVYKLDDDDGKYSIKNTYTVETDETISAVGTYFVDKSEYDLSLYINNQLVTTTSNTINHAGYNTIYLDNFYRVHKNDQITVQINFKQTISNNCVYVPLQDTDYPLELHRNESFISYDGINFEDLYDYGSVAPIKVYTLDVPEYNTTIIQKGELINVDTTFSNINSAAKLYYKINDEYILDSNNQPYYQDINSQNNSVFFTYNTQELSENNVLETILVYNTLNITKTTQFILNAEIKLELDDIIGYVSTPVIIQVNVTQADVVLSEGYVLFKDADEKILAQLNLSSGNNSISLIFNKQYDTQITAEYVNAIGDVLATNSSLLLIKKVPVNIAINQSSLYSGEKVNLTAILTDINGQAVASGKMVFKINGKTVKDENGKVIYANVVDGVAIVEYTVADNLSGKNINITASYVGASKYENAKVYKEVPVQQASPTLIITPITEEVHAYPTITINARISNGNAPITVGKMVFKINGKTVKDENGKVIYASVDANGTVSFDYNVGNLKANTYNLTATFIASGYDKIQSDTIITLI